MKPANPPKETVAAVDTAALDALFEPVNRGDAPGLVVGIALDGATVYRRGFGLASLEHGVANTPWTRMRIGSTSKHFASLAALLLAEEGKLDVDAGARRWLPELRAPADPAHEPTLRQFMAHTSGLRDSLDVGFLASGMTIKPKGDSLAVQARQRDVNFAPGDRQIYNNGGYHLLALAIERAAGMPFEQFLAERLFDPLGMRDTRSVPSDFEIHPGMATMHVAQPDGGWRRGIFPSEEVRAEGAIVSTVDDMLRWLAHLRGPHVVGSAASWAQLKTPARLNNGTAHGYALGLQVEDYRGVEVIHHGGTVIGGTCQMLTVPAHALDVIIIANGAPVSVSELANRVVDIVLGDAALPRPAPAMAECERFRPLVGARYASPSADMVFGFGDAGGKLGFVIHNSPPIPARAEAGALFLEFARIVTGPYRVIAEPLAADAAAPDTLQLEDAGTMQTLARLPAAPPSAAQAGRALVGRYRAPDLDADAEIALDGDALRMRVAGVHGPNTMTLTPYSDDVFGWNFTGQLAALGGTLAVERRAGKVAGLRMNTLRTRHMHFVRVEEQ
ncbi:serine hydrolase [uncultured Massilia sp.]|uniref:serine hydrolase domain-containing protein n=1 Tax=uncultured Massilia sp. TaxID=169973 RepID=UPI0025DE4448|nr:serine hydrolase domain-containing protein [uncultured Massilia sp.]